MLVIGCCAYSFCSRGIRISAWNTLSVKTVVEIPRLCIPVVMSLSYLVGPDIFRTKFAQHNATTGWNIWRIMLRTEKRLAEHVQLIFDIRILLLSSHISIILGEISLLSRVQLILVYCIFFLRCSLSTKMFRNNWPRTIRLGFQLCAVKVVDFLERMHGVHIRP